MIFEVIFLFELEYKDSQNQLAKGDEKHKQGFTVGKGPAAIRYISKQTIPLLSFAVLLVPADFAEFGGEGVDLGGGLGVEPSGAGCCTGFGAFICLRRRSRSLAT